MNNFRIHRFNEHSLLIDFPDGMLLEANVLVQDMYSYLLNVAGHLLLHSIPSYRSLMVICKKKAGSVNEVSQIIENYSRSSWNSNLPSENKEIVIPVCYDLQLGNDLSIIADIHQISLEEIINLHQAVTYKVFMLGFLPGFPYMGEVVERIATPRKAKPVPAKAGAVGIAGRQTGIYPVNSPGGWHIVGYTPVKMFDAQQKSPALLQPGNLVKFESIPFTEYLDLNKN